MRQSLDEHKPTPLDAVRAEFDLPATSEFLGYVVLLSERDEFLTHINSTALVTQWAWAKTPDLAHRYHDFADAWRVSEKYGKDRVVVALLFDLGDQLYVAW